MKNITLNDTALRTACTELSAIAQDAAALHREVETLLEEACAGFDTPAGRKLLQSSTAQVLQPLADQSAMLEHISQVLAQANTGYQPVFTAYQALNNSLNQSGL